MSEEEKGKVHRFKAPEKSPIGKLQERIEKWNAERGAIIEQGSDEEFERIKGSFVKAAAGFDQREDNKALLSGMARDFEAKRREFSEKAGAAKNAQERDRHVAASLRYAELAGVINRITGWR